MQRVKGLFEKGFIHCSPPFSPDFGKLGQYPKEVELCFYRVAQEALHNIAKHSSADRAEIKLSSDGSFLRMEISDNGKGFDPTKPSQGLGLASMRERLSIVGGNLQIRSIPGHGTVLLVQAPLAGRANPQIRNF